MRCHACSRVWEKRVKLAAPILLICLPACGRSLLSRHGTSSPRPSVTAYCPSPSAPFQESDGQIVCAARGVSAPNFPANPFPSPVGANQIQAAPHGQREAAVYTAMLRYALAQLLPAGPTTSGSQPKIYVETSIFSYAGAGGTSGPSASPSPEGSLATEIQHRIADSLAPTSIAFVPDPASVISCSSPGYGFLLGSVPQTGDQVQVYLGERYLGSNDAIYSVSSSGASWTVTGVADQGPTSLGDCG